jgi:hypothetical protein
MVRLCVISVGALFLAAPVFSQADPQVKGKNIRWFSLREDRAGILKILGPAKTENSFGQDFQSLQFQIAGGDTHEFSHQVVLRRSTGAVVSVTRTWDEPRRLDALFPARRTQFVQTPDGSFTVAVRRLSGGRVLVAPGVSGPETPGHQIVLIAEAEIAAFFPFLAVRHP